MNKEEGNNIKNQTEFINGTKTNLKEEEAEKNKENDEALFDSLIEKIGNNGKFQNRMNYLYNLVFVMLITMPFCNIILAMTVPDHWCYVPGREYTNYTLEEWKEKWSPKYVVTFSFYNHP